MPAALALLLRLLAATWRVRRPAWPVEGPCVVALLHGHILPMVALHRGLGLTPLASLSADGGRAAAVLGALGYTIIRGSTSRGGLLALRAAERLLASGGRPAIPVDGPRGPAGVPGPGAEALATRAGVPIVLGVVAARGLRLRSWDRFLIPYPFAQVRVVYAVWTPGDEPLEVAFRRLQASADAPSPFRSASEA